MKKYIHRIVTGHEKQDMYAEQFLRTNVVAVGWSEVGDITNMKKGELKEVCKDKLPKGENVKEATSVLSRFKDKIKIGDYVIAYKSPNTIVAVGEVVSDYFFNDKDKLGDPNGLHYAHKRRVNWKEKPRMFNRNFLNENLSSTVSVPGTLITLEYDIGNLEKELEKIPEEEEKEKLVEVESEEKIRLYYKNNIEQLGKSFTSLDDRETSIGQVDILAKDGDFWVVIEVKRNASDSSVGQLLGYMGAIKNDKRTDKIKGIIIAESFNDRVKKARDFLRDSNIKITLYKCRLKFEGKFI